MIGHLRDRTVRHVFHDRNLGTGYIDQAPGVAVGLTGRKGPNLAALEGLDFEKMWVIAAGQWRRNGLSQAGQTAVSPALWVSLIRHNIISKKYLQA